MGIPLRQNLRVARHVLSREIRRQGKYPLVIELEPLFACNLRCPGCGKTEHPPEILARRMSIEEAVAGVVESEAPIVSIAGGEPLLHSDIVGIVEGLISRRISVYLCTNGLLLRERLDSFSPSPYFAWVVHLDGLGDQHDRSVDRKGVFEEAVCGVKEARTRGFRVTTNSTLFSGAAVTHVVGLLDFLCLELGVDSVMVSPAHAQENAADQDAFPAVAETRTLFRDVLDQRRRNRWRFNHSPLYLEFLAGRADLPCTPWAIPSFSVLGWQRPCYLLADGHAESYRELVETTDWASYGRGKDPRCSNCMAHCGYEPSAVIEMLRSPFDSARTYLRR
jgi:hopanoid biosynthesis associated radical SAM protein HpnH